MKRVQVILSVVMSMVTLGAEESVGSSNVIAGDMVADLYLNDTQGFTVTDTATGFASNIPPSGIGRDSMLSEIEV